MKLKEFGKAKKKEEDLTPREKLWAAFDNIFIRYPYLSTIVASWHIIETKSLPTAATDGPNLLYNPDFLKDLNISECTDLIFHEAGHIFLGHHFRFEGKHPSEWNVAADLALNDNLSSHYHQKGKIREMGLFPGERMFAHLPKGKNAEFYYGKVRNMMSQLQDCPACKGTGKQECKGCGGTGQEGEGKEKGEGNGDAHGEGKPHGECSGSGQKPCDKCHGSGKKNSPFGQGVGEVRPYPAMTEEEKQEAEEKWEKQLEKAMQDAKQCGNLPGWIETITNVMWDNPSKVNWKDELRRFLNRASRTRYTYARPNRRSSYRRDVIFPTRKSKDSTKGVVLVDTSGSMADAECNAALREIEAMMQVFENCEVVLRQCDTRLISDQQTFHRWDFPITVPQSWKGRGGTDLSAAINQIPKEHNDAKWLVVVSDMEWNVSSCPNPGLPTIWCMTRDVTSDYSMPTFGKKIVIDVTV